MERRGKQIEWCYINVVLIKALHKETFLPLKIFIFEYHIIEQWKFLSVGSLLQLEKFISIFIQNNIWLIIIIIQHNSALRNLIMTYPILFVNT